MFNAPARRAEHERNSQVLMGRERLERVLVWENEIGKDEYNWNKELSGYMYCEINLEKQVHKLAKMM